ncbi:hypothetical protein BDEG_20640 [Batrachochytrium dendrobatidis JEL423]|uniref:Uncharacterized protein n=1 Tax=Batrachochytrium dendrobatidis (strain JEL423) TaxID=403673 RepID=A0A177W9U1_BATDL|nr:hypothetical protein BDEG_20640 [Batrachochytrium dendrobatidis JEL423]
MPDKSDNVKVEAQSYPDLTSPGNEYAFKSWPLSMQNAIHFLFSRVHHRSDVSNSAPLIPYIQLFSNVIILYQTQTQLQHAKLALLFSKQHNSNDVSKPWTLDCYNM